jgi:hypothetical protein
MPVTRQEIAAELSASDHHKALSNLRRAIADLNAAESQLRAAEQKCGFLPASDMPIVKRLLRLGCDKDTCAQLKELVDALEALTTARPLPSQIQTLLSEMDEARRLADEQLDAIVTGHR